MTIFNLLTPPTHDSTIAASSQIKSLRKRASNPSPASRSPSRMEKIPQGNQMASVISSTVLYLLYGLGLDGITHPEHDQFVTFIQSILSCTENNVNEAVIMMSLLYVSHYVKRISYFSPNRSLSSMIQPNSQIKIWITALMLADAFMNDSAYATKSWALVSHISAEECVKMRRIFLNVLNYDLNVGTVEFRNWVSSVYSLQRKLDYASAARKAQLVDQLHHSRPSMVITPPIPTAATYASNPSPAPLLISPTPCVISHPYPNQVEYRSDLPYSSHHVILQPSQVDPAARNVDEYYNANIQQWIRYPTPPPPLQAPRFYY